MIRSVLSIAALTLCACVSDPKIQPDAARSDTQVASAGEVDMTAMIGKEVDGLTFLQHCQAQTGHNYTYSAATATALEHSYVRWSDQAHLPVAEFDVIFGHILNASGFEIRPVGPPHLDVLMIQQRSG